MRNINISVKKVLVGTLILTSFSTSAVAYQYIIKKGDTLNKISKKAYGTSSYSNELANYNSILDPDFIKVGDILDIPSINTIKNIDTEQYEIYVVKKGDTLSKICKNYYNTYQYVNQLAFYNSISNIDVINVDQIIKLPSKYILEQLDEFSYTIKKGDTLEKIALAYYGKEGLGQLLAEYNCLSANILYEGQIIFIPSYNKMLEFYNAVYNIEKGKNYVKRRSI